jgi:primosomal protein N' (replication factor Y)
MLSLTRWIAEYYLAPWGEVLRAAMPQGLSVQTTRRATLTAADIQNVLSSLKESAVSQKAILSALQKEQTMSVAALQKKTRIRSVYAVLHQLAAHGWVEVREELGKPKASTKKETVVRISSAGRKLLEAAGGKEEGEAIRLTARQRTILRELAGRFENIEEFLPVRSIVRANDVSPSIIKSLIRKGVFESSEHEVYRTSEYDAVELPPALKLNRYQAAALNEIEGSLQKGNYETFLLLGVTGSGKTQV